MKVLEIILLILLSTHLSGCVFKDSKITKGSLSPLGLGVSSSNLTFSNHNDMELEGGGVVYRYKSLNTKSDSLASRSQFYLGVTGLKSYRFPDPTYVETYEGSVQHRYDSGDDPNPEWAQLHNQDSYGHYQYEDPIETMSGEMIYASYYPFGFQYGHQGHGFSGFFFTYFLYGMWVPNIYMMGGVSGGTMKLAKTDPITTASFNLGLENILGPSILFGFDWRYQGFSFGLEAEYTAYYRLGDQDSSLVTKVGGNLVLAYEIVE